MKGRSSDEMFMFGITQAEFDVYLREKHRQAKLPQKNGNMVSSSTLYSSAVQQPMEGDRDASIQQLNVSNRSAANVPSLSSTSADSSKDENR